MGDIENPSADAGLIDVAEAEIATLVRDGLALLTAFRSIADEDVRRSLVTLASALAETG